MKVKSTAWVLALSMCVAPLAALSMRPSNTPEPNFLEATVPKTFGEWHELKEVEQIKDPATEILLKATYAEVLSRAYVNEAGYRIMLSIARSSNQLAIQRAHRPEVCYPAQGFKLIGAMEAGARLTTPYGPIAVNRLITSQGPRVEPVTYWLTMADHVVNSQWDKRIVQIRAIVTGENPGGLLFRVSSIDRNAELALAIQEKFAADMMRSVSPKARSRLSGLKEPAGAT